MNNFFTLQFWLNQRPGLLAPSFTNILIGLIIFSIIATILSLIFKAKKGFFAKLWSRIFNLSLTNAIVGGLLFFFSHEMIPLLSSRFWFLLWAIGFITWVVFIILYVKTLPAKRREQEQEREYKKYIP
jgi:hypothetical protein